MTTAASQTTSINVAGRLSHFAALMPEAVAVAEPVGSGRKAGWRTFTFAELEADSSALAAGMLAMGVEPGMRMALLVRPGMDFISLVFALLKSGIVIVLIDPGMGRGNLVHCLAEAMPEGFIAVPLVHAVRVFLKKRFPQARFHVTAGRRRWFWGGKTLADLRAENRPLSAPPTAAADPAAIIFTTGSTGPPKGVLYRQGNFDRQVEELQTFYGVEPGEVDVAGFPLFGLFNAAMGVTTVIPNMDPTRPAGVDPRNIIAAVNDFQATQAFGSPALWNVVGRYCEEHAVRLPSLRRVLSAGAPVPPHVLLRMKDRIHADGDVHTPYGATEALPVASISATEVLGETAALTSEGRGTCVGRRFPGIEWKVIRISDGPVVAIEEAEELPPGEIGELAVRGDVVTREYVTRTEANALHKIAEGDAVWHRLGDVGYLDGEERFWFCGRKAHRVQTEQGTLFTICCEAIFNNHERVYRSALVGVGEPPRQRPAVVVEPWPEHFPRTLADRKRLLAELRERADSHELTRRIEGIYLRRRLPVDIRHNAKIFREQLAIWVSEKGPNRG